MSIIKSVKKICPCCMKEHQVYEVCETEHTVFKGIELEYDAHYEYCDICDEYNSTEEMISANDIAVKNAYRISTGLLTQTEIISIRKKYGISQADFSVLLGWGAKTITRYESHQVQSEAHDSILRKIDADPEWFLKLLKKNKNGFSETAYSKYLNTANELFEKNKDVYLRKSIEAQYAAYSDNDAYCGNTALNLDKVVEVIRYFANSPNMLKLYKVKLMKLLWYSDTIAYKQFGHSITGLVYRAYPMGALPVAHESLIDLNGVVFNEKEIGDGVAYHFCATENPVYSHLSSEDICILDTIVSTFGSSSKTQIIRKMHNEQAYKNTCPGGIISFKYAEMVEI